VDAYFSAGAFLAVCAVEAFYLCLAEVTFGSISHLVALGYLVKGHCEGVCLLLEALAILWTLLATLGYTVKASCVLVIFTILTILMYANVC